MIFYDTLLYRNRLIWVTSGSPYKDDLPLYPTVDEVVDYVTGRILNGTYKLAPGKYVNNNAIIYNIGSVEKYIR